MKKLVSIVLALALVLAVATAFAGSISITPPSNNPADAANSYEIYKVFDGVGDGEGHISYSLMSGKTAPPTGFELDSAGNIHLTRTTGDLTQLTTAEIEALAAYVANDTPVATATSTGTAVATATGLADGYYYIKTTTGSLVTVDTTNPDATVIDKNTVPELDKKITGASDITDEGKKALAQIGTDVEYTVPITVGKGSINLVFHDTMQTGLTFKGNDSVTVTANPAISIENWYTIKATPDTGDDLTITFADGIAQGTVITVKYLATINADALTKLENDAYLTYGENHHTDHKKTETYNAEISVIKYDGAKAQNKPLEGAGFKLYRLNGTTKEYYSISGTVVSWGADGDEHLSDAEGKVAAFHGLANGTYFLEETTVPQGYNKAADVEVTIASGDYSEANLKQVKEVENNKGTELPHTGGIGTTIFYILGGLLVIGAAVILVARRKAEDK